MNVHLLARVQDLAEARAKHEDVADQLHVLHEAFELEHAALFDALRTAKEAEEQAKRDVKALAETEFEATGEKKVAPGVQIKMMTTVDYDDDDAIAWSDRTEAGLVDRVLRAREFEKVAKVMKLDFVTIREVPSVSIATDLAKALQEVSA